LPQAERELFSFTERRCQKGLPLLRFRNHNTAKKIDYPFAQNRACFPYLACPGGKLFMAKRQSCGGKELFFAREYLLTFLLERGSGMSVLPETVVRLGRVPLPFFHKSGYNSLWRQIMLDPQIHAGLLSTFG